MSLTIEVWWFARGSYDFRFSSEESAPSCESVSDGLIISNGDVPSTSARNAMKKTMSPPIQRGDYAPSAGYAQVGCSPYSIPIGRSGCVLSTDTQRDYTLKAASSLRILPFGKPHNTGSSSIGENNLKADEVYVHVLPLSFTQRQVISCRSSVQVGSTSPMSPAIAIIR